MSATANGFAHAFSTWIAGGNGLNSGRDGVMRYNSGPMRGMTRDAAQMNFQNNVWKNAAPAWKDEYAKRATTGMLAPSEQKAAASTPTVTPPVRPRIEQGPPSPASAGAAPATGTPSTLEDMERDSLAAAYKPMDAPEDVLSATPTVSQPIRRPATSQSAFGSRAGTGASETGILSGARSRQPAFGSRAGTGASQTGRVAQVKVGI